ncbi:hypothetical protein FACS1894181_07530 [Bacteroidia bacterium]|nr:hypothetical protein FACS1894181_07530 [Bacteroidia bacterium]
MWAVAMITVYSCGDSKNTPVSVIFDTDMGPDIDDVGALTILHAMADSGEVRILATLASNQHEYSVPCIDLINTYYGRPGLPVGATLTGPDKAAWPVENWTETFTAHFPHHVKATADAPDAVQVYRRILAGEPDTSVVVVTVGFLTNLSALLQSQPDQYSPLNGKQLVSRKVKHLVAMAGVFPQGSREFNVLTDTVATAMVFEQWPTRIILSGSEIGGKVRTGKRLVAPESTLTPAKDAYMICMQNKETWASYDQTAVLVAVRGVDRYFNTVKGQVKLEANATTSWQDNPGGKHEYLTFKMPVDELEKVIEDLMMHEPVKKSKN